jgi:hypothetical protein
VSKIKSRIKIKIEIKSKSRRFSLSPRESVGVRGKAACVVQ